MSNYAIDTATRFGDIPFVEFSTELITGIFNALVDAHILQMEEYTDFVNSLTQDLSAYINNTSDGVDFDQISDFVLAYELPEVDEDVLQGYLEALVPPGTVLDAPSTSVPTDTSGPWWAGVINTLGPAVGNMLDNVTDPNNLNDKDALEAVQQYNNGIISTLPSFGDIQKSISNLIASNKYSLLQNMANQGMMRLVVTEGEIETKITFSTWNNSSSGTETGYKNKVKEKIKKKKTKGGGFLGFYKNKRKTRSKRRTVTVNTAKSYQRDSSGTKVDIFGRVLIRFKTDYAPLNG